MCDVFFSFTKNGGLDNFVLDMVVITVLIIGFLYGVLSIVRDLKEYGTFDTLRYWIKKIKK